ncbi:MAG: hypothetical protein ACLQVY_09620 [Limisphaerales bacterium]
MRITPTMRISTPYVKPLSGQTLLTGKPFFSDFVLVPAETRRIIAKLTPG